MRTNLLSQRKLAYHLVNEQKSQVLGKAARKRKHEDEKGDLGTQQKVPALVKEEQQPLLLASFPYNPQRQGQELAPSQAYLSHDPQQQKDTLTPGHVRQQPPPPSTLSRYPHQRKEAPAPALPIQQPLPQTFPSHYPLPPSPAPPVLRLNYLPVPRLAQSRPPGQKFTTQNQVAGQWAVGLPHLPQQQLLPKPRVDPGARGFTEEPANGWPSSESGGVARRGAAYTHHPSGPSGGSGTATCPIIID